MSFYLLVVNSIFLFVILSLLGWKPLAFLYEASRYYFLEIF
jgi:hypothetical protein